MRERQRERDGHRHRHMQINTKTKKQKDNNPRISHRFGDVVVLNMCLCVYVRVCVHVRADVSKSPKSIHRLYTPAPGHFVPRDGP